MSATSRPGTPPRCGHTGPATSTECRTPPSATRSRACRARRGVNAGERRALWHYRLRGYRIIGTNVRAGRNELDLIVRRGRELTFVEVKQRRGRASAEPSARSTPRSVAGSDAAAQVWLSRNPQPPDVRIGFEVVTVEQGRLSRLRTDLIVRVGETGPRGDRTRRGETDRRGGHPGSALPGARSRAVVVGDDAARARADEARPPTASVPREVHPAARRDAARAARSRRAAVFSTRLPAPARRSCRPSSRATTRPASTSRASTPCSYG